MKRINCKRICEIIDESGMSHVQASAAIGASHSYIDKSLSKREMSERYFYAFCNVFNVSPCEVAAHKKSSEPKGPGEPQAPIAKRRGVSIKGNVCRQLVRKKGLGIDEASIKIGASHGYLSNAFNENHISERYLNALADFLEVDKETLITGEEKPEAPAAEDDAAVELADILQDVEYYLKKQSEYYWLRAQQAHDLRMSLLKENGEDPDDQ